VLIKEMLQETGASQIPGIISSRGTDLKTTWRATKHIYGHIK
jgi:hypothetical protein